VRGVGVWTLSCQNIVVTFEVEDEAVTGLGIKGVKTLLGLKILDMSIMDCECKSQ
jgi:hypothetical protein